MKPRNREHIEEKIIENQVRATIEQRKNRPGASLSAGAIAKEIKQKSNYRHLAYQNKDIYLEDFIARVIAAPSVVQEPVEAVERTSEDITTPPSEKSVEHGSQSSQEALNSINPRLQEILDNKELSMEEAINGVWRTYQQDPESSRP